MSLLNSKPADAAADGATKAPPLPGSDSPATRPENVPEKFWKEGKLATDDILKSYNELETWKSTKTEELLGQLKGDLFKGRPESADKYEVKPIEGVNMDELSKHPVLAKWREMAHGFGADQEKFQAGVENIINVLKTGGADLEAERKQLGDNAEVRINAVTTWAKGIAKDAAEFEAVKGIAATAAGIRFLEKAMGKPASPDNNPTPPVPELTAADLKKMQADPRYWDPGRRDPAFVLQIDQGFEKLYGKK